MNKMISISQTAKILGVHVQTLRNWERTGRLVPDSISPGGTRRYGIEQSISNLRELYPYLNIVSGKRLNNASKEDITKFTHQN